jgi:hypothetical protein
MKLFETIKNIGTGMQTKLFRRDVESAFFSNKKFRLPQVNYVSEGNIQEFKNNYPFIVYPGKEKFEEYSRAFGNIEDTAALTAVADKILENFFLFPGNNNVYLGDKIKWNYDYINNYEWEKSLSWKKDFINASPAGDISIPWSLARFNQGITLGKAYLATNDIKYAKFFISLLNDFTAENPFCTGINWLSAYHVSIRLLNVLYSFGFFIKSNEVNAEVINRLLEFTLESAVFIDNSLDYSPNRGTELLISYLGLLAAGLMFDKTHFGSKILSKAQAGFEQETRRLVYISGVYKGQAVLHSTLVLETLFYADIFIKKRGRKFSPGYSSIIENMFLVFLEYLRADKTIPLFGDDFITRIIPLTQTPAKKDFTYMAAIGAYYFNIETLKNYAPKPTAEILFLFGLDALEKFEQIKTVKHEKKSTSIEPGGVYFLRNKELDIFVKCGEIGFGAPSHNDALSFDIFYKGNLLVTDSGTYSIYKDEKTRNEYRSVKAHNTAYIDGMDLAEFDGIFGLKEDLTKPKIIEWNTLGEEDILTVQHYAYTGSADPAICKRSFILNKAENSLKIKDEFFGGKKHRVNLNLHFHPGIKISEIEKNSYSLEGKNSTAIVSFTSPSDILKTAISTYNYSEIYGSANPACVINILMQDQFPSFFVTEFRFK